MPYSMHAPDMMNCLTRTGPGRYLITLDAIVHKTAAYGCLRASHRQCKRRPPRSPPTGHFIAVQANVQRRKAIEADRRRPCGAMLLEGIIELSMFLLRSLQMPARTVVRSPAISVFGSTCRVLTISKQLQKGRCCQLSTHHPLLDLCCDDKVLSAFGIQLHRCRGVSSVQENY